ncbi:GNAT family N-acetyltransferase [Streptomyces sp. NPDC049813]|uniref:GNAT family N-acetyltransferase n=1 Tax=Streptomyces sp. NPDC049813 TaxID=3365597 RepID=UPI00379A7B5F
MTPLPVRRLTADQFPDHVDKLGELLADTVRGGNSLGFLHGLTARAAADWWHARTPDVRRGTLTVWAALDEASGRCAGTVSLALGDRDNGRHRAEVVKLMVHGSARGRGLGRALLAAAEAGAAAAGRTLLVLDTETGSPAERLYAGAGWTRAGIIPDYAADPTGTPRPTTLFYKRLGPTRPTRPAGRQV